MKHTHFQCVCVRARLCESTMMTLLGEWGFSKTKGKGTAEIREFLR